MPKPIAGEEVTLSELDGVRYLHFGTEWVQGAMQIARPWRLELEYQQQMMAPLLFVPEPGEILQLGLGAAALTKFCYRYLRAARITVVELSPQVIGVARQWFGLPPDDERLRVVAADAGRYLRECNGAAAGAVDWLQVDLYDARARGPVLDDAAFYRACRGALRPGGVAAFNLFGSSLQPSLRRLQRAFGAHWLRLPRSAAGNTVVLAFAPDALADAHGAAAGHATGHATGNAASPALAADAAVLQRRARQIEQRHGLPMLDWLEGMRTASARRLIGTARRPRPDGAA